MRQRAPLPDSLGATFTSAAAAAEGWATGRLRRPDVLHPFHGVRARLLAPIGEETPAETWRRSIVHRARAFALVMAEDAFFCLRTAVVLHDLAWPDIEDVGDVELDVGVFRPGRAPRGRGIRGHQLTRDLGTVVLHSGLRVTSPATTWAMLGRELSLRDLVAMGDEIVRVPRMPGTQRIVRAPLGTIEQLRAATDAGRRAGVGALRQALPLIRLGSASPPETHARLLLVDAGLPEPALDVDVFDSRGALIGCSELAYPEFKVAVEYEGDHHRVERKQWNRDIDKYHAYAEAGWRPVRLTSTLLYVTPSEAVRRVVSTLRAAGWPG